MTAVNLKGEINTFHLDHSDSDHSECEKRAVPAFCAVVVLDWQFTIAHAFMAAAFFHQARKSETKTWGLRQINPSRVHSSII